MKTTWYNYLFADGTMMQVRGMSKTELQHAERLHGRLVSKEVA